MKVGTRKPAATTPSAKSSSATSHQSVGAADKLLGAYGAADSSPDSVNIQSQAAQLFALEAQMADISVVDTEKVDAIKNAIALGQFNVDAERVADKLLEVAREHLLSAPRTPRK